MGFLRLIASSKTTISLLVLWAIVLLPSVAGGKLPILLKPLGSEFGLQSWPSIAVMVLLLLNQFAAAITRLTQSMTRRKDPFFSAELDVQDDDDIMTFDEYDQYDTYGTKPKKKGKPLPQPRAQAAYTGQIETLLPSENAESVLMALGFKHIQTDKEDSSAEKVVARKGGGTGLYSFLLHIGAMILLLGWIHLLTYAPSRNQSAPLNEKVTLGGPQATPFQKLLTQVSLSQKKSVETPSVSFTISKLTLAFTKGSLLKRPSNLLKRFESGLNDTILQPKALEAFQYSHPYIRNVSAEINFDKSLSKLALGETRQIGPYRVHFANLSVKAQVKINNEKKVIKRGDILTMGAAKVQIGGISLTPLQQKSTTKRIKNHVTNYINQSNDTPDSKGLCLIVVNKNSKQPPRCLSVGSTYSVNGQTLTLISLKQGANIQYHLQQSHALIWVGLLLFLFGFIGFWWPQRYQATIVWRHGKNDITVEGTGLGVSPKSMVHHIEKSLYFPPEWLGAPSKKKSSAVAKTPSNKPHTPPVPAPPAAPRQPVKQQAQQTQQALTTPKAQQNKPLPPVPAPPSPTTSQQQKQQAKPTPKAATPKVAPPTTQQPTQRAAQPKAAPQTQQQPVAKPVAKPTAVPSQPNPAATSTTKATQVPAPKAPSVPTPAPKAPQATQSPKTETAPVSRIGVGTATSPHRRTDSFSQSDINDMLEKQTNTKPTAPPAPPKQAAPKPPAPKPAAAKPPAPKNEGFDVDALFSDLQSTPKPKTKKSGPTDFNELDLDALFDDFDKQVDKKKP